MRTNLTVDNYRRFFQQKTSSLWKNCGFLDCFLGTKVTTLICGWSKYDQSHMNVLLISKVDNIQNPCLSLKSGFFLYFIGLWILLSWTNMAPKIYRDCPWILYGMNICRVKVKFRNSNSWSEILECVLPLKLVIATRIVSFWCIESIPATWIFYLVFLIRSVTRGPLDTFQKGQLWEKPSKLISAARVMNSWANTQYQGFPGFLFSFRLGMVELDRVWDISDCFPTF